MPSYIIYTLTELCPGIQWINSEEELDHLQRCLAQNMARYTCDDDDDDDDDNNNKNDDDNNDSSRAST